MSNATDINFKMGGEAGDGILSAGLIFSKAASSFYHTFGYPEYPSLVRGGHNSFQIRLTQKPCFSPKNDIDVLLALNEEAVRRNLPYLKQTTKIIYDPETVAAPRGENNENLIPVDLKKIALTAGGPYLRNTVGISAALGLLCCPWENLEESIKKSFPHKEEKIRQQNFEAARRGYQSVKRAFPESFSENRPEPKTVLTGNEALGLSAIAADLGFAAIYPMTPISNLLHFLKRYENRFPYQIIQPADEIEGIQMAIGAAYAGKRALVATSGGGFSLMVESLGLAAQSETPLVIVLGSRPGPATGLPTWTEQGDLQFALHAAQGDFPRLVFTPGDLRECLTLTNQAFYLAEKYQLPAIILVDKFLCESHASINYNDLDDLENTQKTDKDGPLEGRTLERLEGQGESFFARYRLTPNGVSPHSPPGLANAITKTSADEHDELGLICEDAENRQRMMEKRARKLTGAEAELKGCDYLGPDHPDLLLVSWGSTKGSVREAQEILTNKGQKTAHLHLNVWSPFPAEEVTTFLNQASQTVLIENNFSAQGGAVIREKTGIEIKNKFLKYNGRPIYQDEVVDFVAQYETD